MNAAATPVGPTREKTVRSRRRARGRQTARFRLRARRAACCTGGVTASGYAGGRSAGAESRKVILPKLT